MVTKEVNAMLNIYLLSNSGITENGLKSIVAKYCSKRVVQMDVITCHSIKKLLKIGDLNGILFIDDCFEERSVTDVARLLREHKIDIPIVLISDDIAVAFEGYKVEAFRVLKPPIADLDIFELFDGIKNEYSSKKVIVIATGKRRIHYKIGDILYVTSGNRETTIVTKDHVDVTSLPLFQIYNQLPEDFFIQCHKSCIVNLINIRSISVGTNTITMTNGEEIPISRRRKLEFSEARERFIEEYTYTFSA